MSQQLKPPTWAPSHLTRIARSPVTYWMLAALLAVVTATITHRMTTHAEALEKRYGRSVEVLVTDQMVPAGDLVGEIASLRPMPLALVPADAVTEVASDTRTSRSISAGAIVTHQDLNPAGVLSMDQAVIAIATGASTPHLVAGQSVLAIVHADPFSGLEPAVIEATVHEADTERLSLRVARRDLVTLTSALQNGQVTIAAT